jgi:hypothetical protein
MSQCATCGNDYEPSITVVVDGQSYDFDCFECAIHRLAPSCKTCGCRILGHGVQANDLYFCSAHCARVLGIRGVETHVEQSAAQ